MSRAPSAAPSTTLVTAALAGLLGVAVACSSDVKGGRESPSPDGGVPEPGRITSSVVDPSMTLEKFTTMCDERGGSVQLHAHCGGANTCKGFSFDDATFELTEHTCRGLNTCSGYSCVIP